MPNYGTAQPGGVLTSLMPGDQMYLFNNENPAASTSSIAFNRGPVPGLEGPSGIVFSIDGPVGILIQGANVDTDAEYRTLYQSTVTKDYYPDMGNFGFYRAQSPGGGAVTVIAQR